MPEAKGGCMAQTMTDSHKQCLAIKRLAEKGYITNVVKHDSLFAKLEWTFSFGSLVFHHDESTTPVDFSKYRMRLVYRPNKKGNDKIKVFIEEPALEKKKHFWQDGSLCLWKGSNFQWKKGMNIEKDLFPSICTWIYHYEKWVETGFWHGEEANH
ncbi:MAG: hypothetical protein IPL27_17335 [Lewinellaceae bacterium]|nr:hypothetical protein [Lewinellaceae bacterium]